MNPRGLTFAQAMGLLLPAVIGALAILVLVSGDQVRYVWSIVAILMIAYAILIPVLATEIIAEARSAHAALRARAKALGIPLLSRVGRRAVPEVVAVAAVRGRCPLGFSTGDRWQVGPDGRLDRPLCERAISSLNSRSPAMVGFAGQVRCICPIGGQSLTLETQPV